MYWTLDTDIGQAIVKLLYRQDYKTDTDVR